MNMKWYHFGEELLRRQDKYRMYYDQIGIAKERALRTQAYIWDAVDVGSRFIADLEDFDGRLF